MLSQPATVVTPAFRVLSQIKGAVQRVGSRRALGDGRKIKDGKGIMAKFWI